MKLSDYIRLYRSARLTVEREKIRQRALINLKGDQLYQFINLIKKIR